ncbi:UDP-4-amino-4,6-dideoxy-N-acetyl-beta-L-altrosamine N-acetyltransferase [Maricaulis sp. CAU 1757]
MSRSPATPHLSDGTTTLRPVTADDIWLIHAWRNAPHVRAGMYTSHDIGRDEHQAWFDGALADPGRHLWILQRDGQDLGHANISGALGAEADWAIYIGEPGPATRGIGQATGRQILRFAFEHLKLPALHCEVLDGNDTAMHMNTRLGFTRWRRLPARILRDGAPVDAWRLRLTRTDWLDRQSSKDTDDD